jgi:predicted KAP-like P-loop ATPase
MRIVAALVIAACALTFSGVLFDILADSPAREGMRAAIIFSLPLVLLAVFVFALRTALVVAVRWLPQPPPLQNDSHRIATAFSDDAIDLSRVDDYDRMRFATAVADAMNAVVEGGNSSTVIGLAGTWGLGKTGVLDSLVAHLGLPTGDSTPSTWLISRFSPWRYVTFDSMVSGFFKEVRGAIPTSSRWDESRDSLAALLRSASDFGALGTPIGFDLTRPLSAAANHLDKPTDSTLTRRAEEALRALGRPILVVIDDLDRLTPDELVVFFKLTRSLGRLPNIHYLLSYDEKSIESSLTRSGLVKDMGEAHAYLEKIVQYRFDVPPIRESQIRSVLNKHFAEILGHLDMSVEQTRVDEFDLILQTYLLRYLRTPRAIERWMAHLDVLIRPLHNEVDFYDFALVLWLRLTFPRIAEMLQLHQDKLFNGGLGILMRPTAPDEDEEYLTWWNLIEEAEVLKQDVEILYALLGKLFPTIEKARLKRASSYGGTASGTRLGVGHRTYFARYFSYQVPIEELSEAILDREIQAIVLAKSRGLSEFAEEIQGESVAPQLTELVTSNPSEVLNRLELRSRSSTEVRVAIIFYLAILYPRAEDSNFFSGANAIRGLMRSLLSSSIGYQELVAELLSQTSTLAAGAIVSADLIRQESLDSEDLNSLVETTTAAILRQLDSFAVPRDIPDTPTFSLFWTLRLFNPLAAREWFMTPLREGRWSVVDGVALLVSRRRYIGAKDAPWRAGPVDAEVAQSVLDMPWIRERVSAHPEELQGPTRAGDDFNEPEATWETCLAIARDWLTAIAEANVPDAKQLPE